MITLFCNYVKNIVIHTDQKEKKTSQTDIIIIIIINLDKALYSFRNNCIGLRKPGPKATGP